MKIILNGGPEILNAFELAICNLEDNVKMHEQFGDNDLKEALDKLWKEEAEKRKKEHPQSLAFNRYFELLDKYSFNKLSKAAVQLKECPEVVLYPFSESPPKWWNVYNGLKHDKNSSLMEANLLTALTCLAALFWLANNNSKELLKESISSGIFNLPSGQIR